METAELLTTLQIAIHLRDFGHIRKTLANIPPSELATMVAELSVADQAILFRVLPRQLATATFEYLPLEGQEALLKGMGQEQVTAILNAMSPDDRTTLLDELPGAMTKQLLTLLSDEERAVAIQLLGYPENSIGRLMTPAYVTVRPEWTVAQTLDYVREHGRDSETLSLIYIVDEHGVLLDELRIRRLLLSPLNKRLTELMDNYVVGLKATDEQETAIQRFRDADLFALPVTDSDGVLIGIVTIDDVLDIAEAAATEDIQKIGGLEALDEPYMQIAFSRMVRKRASWLIILFVSEMLTATAMSFFEGEIQRAVVLALFVPLIISSGGNSGSQAATLVIRALAVGEVTLRDWWRIMRRELLAGLSLGAILGMIGFLRISLWSLFSTIYGPHWFLVALTVGIALVGIVLWGTVSGSMLPLILKSLGFDPATSSAPFVATLVDVTGLVIYFSVALLLLRGTML